MSERLKLDAASLDPQKLLAELSSSPSWVDAIPPESVASLVATIASLLTTLTERACRLQQSDIPAQAHRDGELFLSVRELANRIPYAEHTIRNLMSSGALIEGKHYVKPRGRVMFLWSAVDAWLKENQLPRPEGIQLVRKRRYGR